MDDPFHLVRFIDAQADVYAGALNEIRRGRKQSHWMWFIFPQFDGLGMSAMANRYAIKSRAEAVAYLAHPLLGARYRECVEALQMLDVVAPDIVFGAVDAQKLQSSLTLFGQVNPALLYREALDRWFQGQLDARTIALMDR